MERRAFVTTLIAAAGTFPLLFVPGAEAVALPKTLVLGHIVSEEPGLEWTVQWLQPQLPGIKITHIPSGDAFK
jgi:hypothetical protein